jgi:hypothetical protein
VPDKVKNNLKTSTWELKELRAVEAAAAHYAPILGKARARSAFGDRAQGITTVGRVKQAIDKDSKKGTLDTTTLGEQFSTKANMGLFDASTNYIDTEFTRQGGTGPDNETSLEATAIHEMAHGLVAPDNLKPWASHLDYWKDKNTPSGTKGVEEPPTEYGETNASEDLCESVAMYFVNSHLKTKCPKRWDFVDKVVKAGPEQLSRVVDEASRSGCDGPGLGGLGGGVGRVGSPLL